MTPKPFVKCTPRRLPERKAVTIVAGFKCGEGIVLCADTQETIDDISKRNVPKLRFESSGITGDEYAVAFCGATTNGPFLDEIVDRAWEDVQLVTSLDEACEAIKKSIKRSYKEFGHIYQSGYCPHAELIYAIKMHGSSRMFHAFGPAVNEKSLYMTAGAGGYLADFLSSRMYDNSLSIRQCMILAAYVLFQTKEHVPACGGESQIAVLRNQGSSGHVERHHIEVLTKLVRISDREISKLIMEYANLDVNNDKFLEKSKQELGLLVSARSHNRHELKMWEEFWFDLFGTVPTDDLGLPAKLNGEIKKEEE